MSTSGGYHEYIGGIPWVHRGDIMSTLGDVQYIGGISWYVWGIPWVHRGYHEYIGGISWVHRGMFSTWGDVQYIGVFNRNWKDFIKLLPHIIMISLRCTEHPPMYSWYPPDVLIVSLRCTEHPPMYSWYPPTFIMIPPDVLNIPRCTHDIPPMYSWYPPDVLMISPRCTHDIPPMYSWNPPDVLNTPRCTEHTLYRVVKWFFFTSCVSSQRFAPSSWEIIWRQCSFWGRKIHLRPASCHYRLERSKGQFNGKTSVWLKFSRGKGWWHLQNPSPLRTTFAFSHPLF